MGKRRGKVIGKMTYFDQNRALQQTFPRIIAIKLIRTIKKDWPLITQYRQLSTAEFFPSPSKEQLKGSRKASVLKCTHPQSDQSTPVGQRRAPVTLWLKPRSIFTLRVIGGTRGSPRGTSQSIIADFKLFVSSDLALEAPFWIWKYIKQISPIIAAKLTMVAMPWTSSSDAAFMSLSSRPGILFNNARKTLCSRRSLGNLFGRWVGFKSDRGMIWMTYWAESSSSGLSEAILIIPLFIKEGTLQSACIDRPKCRPWCTRGSVEHLSIVIFSTSWM